MKKKLTSLARKLSAAAVCAVSAIAPAFAASSSAAASSSSSASSGDDPVTYAIVGVVFVVGCLALYFVLPKLAVGARSKKTASKKR